MAAFQAAPQHVIRANIFGHYAASALVEIWTRLLRARSGHAAVPPSAPFTMLRKRTFLRRRCFTQFNKVAWLRTLGGRKRLFDETGRNDGTEPRAVGSN